MFKYIKYHIIWYLLVVLVVLLVVVVLVVVVVAIFKSQWRQSPPIRPPQLGDLRVPPQDLPAPRGVPLHRRRLPNCAPRGGNRHGEGREGKQVNLGGMACCTWWTFGCEVFWCFYHETAKNWILVFSVDIWKIWNRTENMSIRDPEHLVVSQCSTKFDTPLFWFGYFGSHLRAFTKLEAFCAVGGLLGSVLTNISAKLWTFADQTFLNYKKVTYLRPVAEKLVHDFVAITVAKESHPKIFQGCFLLGGRPNGTWLCAAGCNAMVLDFDPRFWQLDVWNIVEPSRSSGGVTTRKMSLSCSLWYHPDKAPQLEDWNQSFFLLYSSYTWMSHE